MFKQGDEVWYHPIIGHSERYAAIVATDPFELGDGTRVVHLEIDPSEVEYITRREGKRRIHAVCAEALEERVSY